MSEIIEKVIDDLFVYLELSSFSKRKIKGKDANLSFEKLSPSQPIGIKGIDLLTEEYGAFIDMRDVYPKDVSNKINYAVLNQNNIENSWIYQIAKVKSVRPSECRGKIRIFSPTIVNILFTHIWADGGYATTSCYFIYDSRQNKWVDATQGLDNPFNNPHLNKAYQSDDQKINNIIKTCICLQFYSRYTWIARLGYSGKHNIDLWINPRSARHLFKLRDIPEGGNRRAAIKNWVSQHWRQKDYCTEEDRVFVRQHLRGAIDFKWRGFNVQIIPSEYDLEQNEKLRIDRELMKGGAA